MPRSWRERLRGGAGRVEQLAGAVDDLRGRLRRQRKLIDRHGRQIERLRATTRKRGEAERERAGQLRMLLLDFERMSSQLGSLEKRFADALERAEGTTPPVAALAADGPAADGPGADLPVDPAVAEVRARLEEVRREHEQIRVRFRVVTAYEERIRRLEQAAFGDIGVLE